MPEAVAPFDPEELLAWVASAGFPAQSLTALAGDVSPRSYFRARSPAGTTAILAVYPTGQQSTCRRFSTSSRLLGDAGVAVPAVYACDCERGLMLLEDLGPETLYDRRERPWEHLAPYLRTAIRVAQRIAELPAETVRELSPPLDGELLRRELQQTWDAFLASRGLTGDADLAASLSRALDLLCERLDSGGLVPCHRDFMARNLVPRDSASADLAVLDHQDLRLGPVYYDLASLLNDSLFPPPALEEALLASALGSGENRGAYHRAAAQRTLKAVGTFAAFAARGVPRHLPLIPPTLGRALAHLRCLPETAGLVPALERAWSGHFC